MSGTDNKNIVKLLDGFCYFCESTENLHGHHIDLRGPHITKDSNDDFDNLLTLCARCHHRLHQLLNPHKNLRTMIDRSRRLAEIVSRWQEGETLAAIGRDYGVTRERIRQIVRGYLPKDAWEPQYKSALKGHTVYEVEVRIGQSLEGWVRNNADSKTPSAMALGLGVNEAVVRSWLRKLGLKALKKWGQPRTSAPKSALTPVPDDVPIIAKRVAARQLALCLNDGQLAKQIGINRLTWHLIKTGERRPGLKFIRGVYSTWPELATKAELINSLRELRGGSNA